MEKKDLRIVYMGTPEFAVESLKRLVEGGYQVVGVITAGGRRLSGGGSHHHARQADGTAWQRASAEPGETICRVARIEGASAGKTEG